MLRILRLKIGQRWPEDEMLDLADKGDAVREDAGCGVLYGVLRDSGYKIRKLAETEKEAHIKKGWWKEGGIK